MPIIIKNNIRNGLQSQIKKREKYIPIYFFLFELQITNYQKFLLLFFIQGIFLYFANVI